MFSCPSGSSCIPLECSSPLRNCCVNENLRRDSLWFQANGNSREKRDTDMGMWVQGPVTTGRWGFRAQAGEGGSRSWKDQESLYDESGARAETWAVNQIMKGSTEELVGWAVAHREAQREKPVSGSRKQAVTHATDAGFVYWASEKVSWDMALEGLECQAKEFGLDFGGSPEGRQLT